MSDLAQLTAVPARPALADALGRWLPRQRWFAGKARDVVGVAVVDTALLLGDEATVLLVLCEIDYADGGRERYHVPLAQGPDRAPAHTLVTQIGHVVVVDATWDAAASALLAGAAQSDDAHATSGGWRVRGAGTPACDASPAGAVALDAHRRLGVEQSNTSVVFADRTIFKVFRRLEDGINPDVEITRALTAAAFPHAPAQRGALLLEGPGGSVCALGLLTDFVAGAREGWALATGEVLRLGSDQPRPLLQAARELGAAVGALHAVLHDAFETRPASTADAVGWAAGMRAQAHAVLATAAERAPRATAALRARGDDLMTRLDAVAACGAEGPLGRIHGDLHLAQVLLDGEGRWQLLDFEGEPAKPLAQRRALHSPLRDVAGMLRSFDYAAAHADPAGPSPAATAWRDEARQRFLGGYRAAAAAVLPEDPAVTAALLLAFELDKAVYELGYELANRPDWVPIPAGGITRLLSAARPPTG